MPRDLADELFLGVGASATGRRWIGPAPETARMAAAIARAADLDPPVATILARLGVAPEAATAYLAPALRELLPDPRALRDMEAAAARLVAASQGHRRVAIFADYDVDGGASAALLLDWLRAQGQDATLYVPDRIDEGYGPNEAAMARLAADHDLIVCVDCGTLSHGPIAAAAGAEVIVLDHHLAGAELPDCAAVVNPNRGDEDSALGHLCAAGVVFLALVEANRQGRAAGRAMPDLMPLLDLVALATVADVAPLTGVNRAFVRTGLAVMARRGRPGLAVLADTARLDRPPQAYHLGYVLGPRINAGGRIGEADLGARLLAARSEAEARPMAEALERLNTERRVVEAAVRDAAIAQVEARDADAPLVWAAGEGWHPGVVGIVAARLKERFDRPAIVIGMSGTIGKGSGRSVAGIDLGAAIQSLAAEGLLHKGGGHKMAAGLTVAAEGIEAAMDALSDRLARQGAGRGGAADLHIDSLLMPAAASPELCRALEAAGPYGAGAPGPRFAFADLRVAHWRPVGEGHLKVAFSDGGPARLDAIAFGARETGLGALIEGHGGRRLHAAGRIEINHWNGRETVQLRLEDAARA